LLFAFVSDKEGTYKCGAGMVDSFQHHSWAVVKEERPRMPSWLAPE
jgi:hypothetical protein